MAVAGGGVGGGVRSSQFAIRYSLLAVRSLPFAVGNMSPQANSQQPTANSQHYPFLTRRVTTALPKWTRMKYTPSGHTYSPPGATLRKGAALWQMDR